MSRPSSTTAWTTGITTFLVIGAIAWWSVRSGADAAGPDHAMTGRIWTSLQARWGSPACSAANARLQSRESARKRPEGKSGLVIPHAELLLIGAAPTFGPGSAASNRVLVFTSDPTVSAFIKRLTAGDLAGSTSETRIAIDRAATVHVVEIDAGGRVRSIRDIKPVFLTHRPR